MYSESKSFRKDSTYTQGDINHMEDEEYEKQLRSYRRKLIAVYGAYEDDPKSHRHYYHYFERFVSSNNENCQPWKEYWAQKMDKHYQEDYQDAKFKIWKNVKGMFQHLISNQNSQRHNTGEITSSIPVDISRYSGAVSSKSIECGSKVQNTSSELNTHPSKSDISTGCENGIFNNEETSEQSQMTTFEQGTVLSSSAGTEMFTASSVTPEKEAKQCCEKSASSVFEPFGSSSSQIEQDSQQVNTELPQILLEDMEYLLCWLRSLGPIEKKTLLELQDKYNSHQAHSLDILTVVESASKSFNAVQNIEKFEDTTTSPIKDAVKILSLPVTKRKDQD